MAMQSCLLDEFNQIKAHLKNQNREPIHRLRDCLNLRVPIEEFQRFQALILRVSDRFLRLGWPPMRVQASYFSQNGEKSPFEVSWLRTDLLASLSAGGSKTTTSHGPGFRLKIANPDVFLVQMQSRHSIEARAIFIKNVLSPISSRWIDHCLREMRDTRVVLKWTDEWFRIVDLDGLQDLASLVTKSKRLDSMRYSYFSASKRLKPDLLQDEERLARVIVKFFAQSAPLFWGHHIMLEPKAARTQRQTKHQISREQLRKDILRLEDRCQHGDCPLSGGDPRKLKVAHLTPRINLLSNVIVLCPLCYDEQFPATSVIRVRSEEPSALPDRREYSVEIETRDGPKVWRITSHLDHPLKNPRSG
jgi:hypothetical protein